LVVVIAVAIVIVVDVVFFQRTTIVYRPTGISTDSSRTYCISVCWIVVCASTGGTGGATGGRHCFLEFYVRIVEKYQRTNFYLSEKLIALKPLL
jgi:hypothetical protein